MSAVISSERQSLRASIAAKYRRTPAQTARPGCFGCVALKAAVTRAELDAVSVRAVDVNLNRIMAKLYEMAWSEREVSWDADAAIKQLLRIDSIDIRYSEAVRLVGEIAERRPEWRRSVRLLLSRIGRGGGAV